MIYFSSVAYRKLMGFHLDVQEYLEEFIGPNTRRDILYQVRILYRWPTLTYAL